MLRRWILLFAIAFASIQFESVFAGQKVVLLTSIDMRGVSPWALKLRKSYYANYEHRLAAYFEKKFKKRGYELETHFGASQYDLWNALHDPKNIAVFWVSHSGGKLGVDLSSTTHKLIKSGVIQDIKGFDISPVFKEIHPNLRFFGVIGCSSEKVLGFQEDSFLAKHPLLQVMTFPKKVDAKKGLKKAIQSSIPYLQEEKNKRGYPSSCESRMGLPVEAHRVFSDDEKKLKEVFGSDFPPLIRPSVRIETKSGEVLAVFPEVHSYQEVQDLNFYLPTKSVANLQMSGGKNLSLSDIHLLDLGRFSLSSSWGGNWEVWKDVHGLPIGITSHLFEFQKNLVDPASLTQHEEPYYPFACEAMPAL